MKPSENFSKLCQSFEGCKLTTYTCPAGKLTIGWGHTGPDVKPGMTITKEEAQKLFMNDCQSFISWLDNNIKFNNQNKFDAVLDLIYNIGPGNLKKDTKLYDALKEDPDNKEKITSGFMSHVYANGKKLSGLQKRRRSELDLYFKVAEV